MTCFEYYGTDAPASEHDKLDSGTIVIEKYLKRCITDIFDSHKFLNGSMIGLQVEQKEPTNVPSPEKSKKRQALKMLQSGSSGSSSDGDIGNDMTTSEKQRKSKVHKNIKKARKGMQQVIISSRINAFAISAHKKRQSTEATSSLTTKRTYKVRLIFPPTDIFYSFLHFSTICRSKLRQWRGSALLRVLEKYQYRIVVYLCRPLVKCCLWVLKKTPML